MTILICRAAAILAILGFALITAARADINVTPGSGAVIFDFTCFTTKHCPAAALINSAGTEVGTAGSPLRIDPTGTTTQPVSGTVAVTQGTAGNLNATVVGTGTFAVQASQVGTWNVGNVTGTVSLPTGAATAAKQPALGAAGTASADVITIQGVASMTPVVISGTVTANAGTGTLATTNAALALAQGSTTSGQTGPLMQGAVTTAAPTYTTAQTSPLSLDTGGALRVNVVTGGGTGGTSSTFGATFPGTGTAVGMSQGGNMVAITGTSGNLNVQCANCSGSGASAVDEAAFTAGTSVFAPAGGFFQTTATANALTDGQQGMAQMTANRAVFNNLRNAAGTEVGTAGAPLRIDPTGSTTQPVSGTVAFSNTTIAVTNAGTFAVQLTGATNNINNIAGTVSLPTGASTAANQVSEQTPITPATATATVGVLLGGQYNSTQATFTNGQQGAVQLSSRGEVKSNIMDAAGNARGANVTAGNALVVDGSASTQPISGTVTANAGTGTFTVAGTVTANAGTGTFATSNAALALAQASTTSGQTGPLIQCAVTTAAPSYTTAQTDPLSCDTAGSLRVSTGTVTVTATNLSANVAQINGVTPLMGNGVTGTGSQRVTIASDNTAFSVNATLGAETTKVIGTVNIAAAQTIAVTNAGTFATQVAALSLAQGSTTSGQTGPLVQGAVTTNPPTYTTAQTSPASLTVDGGLRMGHVNPAVTTMQNAAVANGNGTSLNVSGYATAALNMLCSVTCSGGTTVNFEASVDDTTFVAIFAQTVGANTIGTTTTAPGDFVLNVAGYKSLRARVSAYSAGTITIKGYQTTAAHAQPVINANIVANTATNQSVNVAQMNGVAVTMGNGVAGTGVQRVAIASDNTAFSVNATLGAETTKVIGTINIAAAQTLATVTTVSTVTNLAQMNGATLLMGNGVTGTGAQRVTIASDNTAFAVNPLSATTPVSTMNSASANSGLNSAMAAVFDDTSPTAITENSFGFLRMSTNRNLYGTIRDAAGNERGVNVNASNQLSVSIDAASATNISTNIAQMNGVAVTMGNGVSGTGVQRVTIASDSTGVVNVGGLAASGATASGNPLLTGGLAVNAEPTAVTNGQAVRASYDLAGKQIVLPYANPENFVSGVITTAMTATTSTSLVAAPAAGLRNYLTACTFSNAHATVGTDIIIQDGSGGTTIWNVPAAAVYGGAHITFPTPLRQPTTATAIFVANVTTGSSTKAACSGYKGA